MGWGMVLGGSYYALVIGVGELWQLIRIGASGSYLLCVSQVACSLGLLLWQRRSPDEKMTTPLAS